jgi:hypothetical protein
LILEKRIIGAVQYKKMLDFFTEVNRHEEQSIVLKSQ